MKKVQYNQIIKGIKLAVEIKNLQVDKWFIENEMELREIDNKIKNLEKKVKGELIEASFITTNKLKDLDTLNTKFENIAFTIYERNQEVYLESINIEKL